MRLLERFGANSSRLQPGSGQSTAASRLVAVHPVSACRRIDRAIPTALDAAGCVLALESLDPRKAYLRAAALPDDAEDSLESRLLSCGGP